MKTRTNLGNYLSDLEQITANLSSSYSSGVRMVGGLSCKATSGLDGTRVRSQSGVDASTAQRCGEGKFTVTQAKAKM